MTAFILNMPPVAKLTDEQFYQLCQANRDLRLEMTAQGELIIMPPTGGETGKRNSDINLDLALWNRQNKLGIVFDSSTGFILPNGAKRSPDAAWIPTDKWDALTSEQKQKFLPLCPDFVIELRSPTDKLKTLQDKMQEYIENGTRLGWLINPQDKQVEIYRQDREVEVLNSPNSLSGENVLPGFILNLELIW
ncbi:MAG: Uma2 family endonuclease [Xenococcaceae cyanobacterium MO_188.B29]|nr:Uma2 family endonuclease [Xenococcaceae cyanobacterium MO_188.B29]